MPENETPDPPSESQAAEGSASPRPIGRMGAGNYGVVGVLETRVWHNGGGIHCSVLAEVPMDGEHRIQVLFPDPRPDAMNEYLLGLGFQSCPECVETSRRIQAARACARIPRRPAGK